LLNNYSSYFCSNLLFTCVSLAGAMFSASLGLWSPFSTFEPCFYNIRIFTVVFEKYWIELNIQNNKTMQHCHWYVDLRSCRTITYTVGLCALILLTSEHILSIGLHMTQQPTAWKTMGLYWTYQAIVFRRSFRRRYCLAAIVS